MSFSAKWDQKGSYTESVVGGGTGSTNWFDHMLTLLCLNSPSSWKCPFASKPGQPYCYPIFCSHFVCLLFFQNSIGLLVVPSLSSHCQSLLDFPSKCVGFLFCSVQSSASITAALLTFLQSHRSFFACINVAVESCCLLTLTLCLVQEREKK